MVIVFRVLLVLLIATAIGFVAQIFSENSAISVTSAIIAAVVALQADIAKEFPKWTSKVIKKREQDARIPFLLSRFHRNGMSSDVFVLSALNYDYSMKLAEIRPNSEEVARDVQEGPGGSGANTAYCLGKLGHRVAICGAIGASDPHSAIIMSDFQNANVEQEYIHSVDGLCGETLILIDGLGRRQITILPNANDKLPALLDQKEINRIVSRINRSQVFHISSFVNYKEMSRPITDIIDKISQEVIVSYVPGDLQCGRDAEIINSKIIKRADVVFMYEHQLAMLMRGDRNKIFGPSEIQTIVGEFNTWKMQLGGSTGSILCLKHDEKSPSESGRVPRFTVYVFNGAALVEKHTNSSHSVPKNLVYLDGTGAGDAAAAGLLSALIKDFELQEAIDHATRISMHAASEVGARRGLDKITTHLIAENSSN